MLGIVRKLVKLAIVLLIANAMYQFVPPYLHYIQFRDAVRELVVFSREVPDGVLVDRVMELADEHSVPLARDTIEIRHTQSHLYIDASYEQVITFVPTYPYTWQFAVTASTDFMPGLKKSPLP